MGSDWDLEFSEQRAHDAMMEHREKEAKIKADLLVACKGLLWPNVPSADDVALLIRMTGTTETQEKAMVLADALRVAQEKAKTAIAQAEGT